MFQSAKSWKKNWHGHPVWFINENPIVGYSKLKNYIQLLFWSGQSFDEDALIKTGKFKAAEIRYNSIEQINTQDLKNWLKKSEEIQWDYKNIIKRNGVLERLKWDHLFTFPFYLLSFRHRFYIIRHSKIYIYH